MNVIALNRQEVYEDIKTVLNSFKLESDNTYRNYERSVRRFFEWYCNTGLEFLNHRHIESISYEDIQNFRKYMKDELGYVNRTINNNVYSLLSVLRELRRLGKHKNMYQVDIEELQVKKLKENDSETYGYVSWEEVDQWIEYMASLPERQNPKRKATLLHIARMTGIRKTGLANLRFKDLRKENGLWVLYHSIKGKRHRIALNEREANMMLSLKETDDPEEKIFKMSTKTIERMLNQIKEHFQIPEERNVVFHSIRGLSGYEAYLASGNDIIVAQKHLGHSDIRTTHNYISKIEDTKNQPTLYMGQDINTDTVKGISKDQWEEIFSQLSRAAKYEVINIIDEMGYRKDL